MGKFILYRNEKITHCPPLCTNTRSTHRRSSETHTPIIRNKSTLQILEFNTTVINTSEDPTGERRVTQTNSQMCSPHYKSNQRGSACTAVRRKSTLQQKHTFYQTPDELTYKQWRKSTNPLKCWEIPLLEAR